MGMSVSGTRVSNSLLAQLATRNINRNMQQMLELQYQLASGLRLYKVSVDPAGTAVALAFQNFIERRSQAASNIDRSNEFLTSTDSALADLQTILNQAADIASTNIGAATDDASRQNAATVVGSLISQLTQLANRQYQGRYLFAGWANDVAPFDLSSTAVRFVGDNQSLYAIIDRSDSVAYNVTAEEAFGTMSGKVVSLEDLDPAVTLTTRLSELNAGQGIRRGTIVLGDGADSTQVDLSCCNTIADVAGAINANGVVSVTADINDDANGLVIRAGGPGDMISVSDLPGGFAARDLGILQEEPLAPGEDLVGQDLDRRLGLTTELAALRGGAGIDQVNGLRLRVGDTTGSVTIDNAENMEDLLNAINYCGLHVQASIDSDGRRLVIANTVASEPMYIGERGGTTATDLGVRSMHDGTLLADLNDGQGVRIVEGATDFEIITHDGSVIPISLSGAATVGDVLEAINSSPDNGGRVVASLRAVSNGISLQDTTIGAEDFRVVRANSSFAAVDLGIEKTTPSPGEYIAGDDVNPIVEHGVFQSLFALRDALQANDSAAISRAGADLQDEVARVARIRGTIGVRMQMLDLGKTRVEDELTQTKGLLSEVRDLDYAEAVSRFQSLQTMFQASLSATANILPLSLMDFLKL